ncbi:translation initiation factor IF-2-like [Meles meles]|uniref:translation initiation factor IF-2-like n=1 Tax=Meles meles TaxID=9662 RepID=UPI001E699A4A|nr:translation initiation factor IF-2-like [Meles meles]
MPRGRSGNGEGLRAGPGSARPGPAPAAPHAPARRRPKAPLAKRPRRGPARGVAAVTVRPRSRPRDRERCGARPSPSPARPAAPAPSAPGAAAEAAAALGAAQPPSERASLPRSCAPRPGARRPLPRRLPALRDVSTSCRTQRRRGPLPPPGKGVRAGRGARGAGGGAAVEAGPPSLAPAGKEDASRWEHSSLRAAALEAGFGEAGLEPPSAGGTGRRLCRTDPGTPSERRVSPRPLKAEAAQPRPAWGYSPGSLKARSGGGCPSWSRTSAGRPPGAGSRSRPGLDALPRPDRQQPPAAPAGAQASAGPQGARLHGPCGWGAADLGRRSSRKRKLENTLENADLIYPAGFGGCAPLRSGDPLRRGHSCRPRCTAANRPEGRTETPRSSSWDFSEEEPRFLRPSKRRVLELFSLLGTRPSFFPGLKIEPRIHHQDLGTALRKVSRIGGLLCHQQLLKNQHLHFCRGHRGPERGGKCRRSHSRDVA